MPFVRISVSAGTEQNTALAIGEAVHHAMGETIDVPPDDRFQVILRHAPGEMIWDRRFLGVERSDQAVFVDITLSSGRSDDKKRALYAAIARNVEAAGVRAADVLIVLTETTRSCWSFGEGLAQYAPAEVAAR